MSIGVLSGLGMGIIVALVPIMVIESVKPEEQALGNGAQNMLQGVLQSVLTQVAFVVVAQNSNVMKGTAFYIDDSFTNGFLLFAGVIAVATLLITLIPKSKTLNEAEVGQAA
jgi:MFS family permease